MNANLRPILAQATNLDKSVLSTPKKSPVFSNVSQSTGLKVLSVTSSVSGYVFTANDRAKLVRTIPGLVIINTAGKGDSLVLGVDVEDGKLSRLLLQLEKDLNIWNISRVDTTKKDTFSYFDGWKLLPRVDKSGMFQLIVNLKTQGWRSREAEIEKRNQLLDLVKNFNIAKIVHGEGETILLVGHVLECVAYSDCIRDVFTMEKRHTWQPKPASKLSSDCPSPGQERHFWVKVKCPELSNLSDAHKQYSVLHHLSTAGKVLQLEHQLFGAVDNYLVVYSEMTDTKTPVLGQQFCLLELWPDSLPNCYTPAYGVDAWGFYSVSGKFPENLNNETRNKFAEDMKLVGAVGFRNGESEDTFSLHFVNSRCLEKISRCAQYTSFRLTILSSLVRKANLDKKLKKLVPAILKYKELKLAEKSSFHETSKVEVLSEDSVMELDQKKMEVEDKVNPEKSVQSKNCENMKMNLKKKDEENKLMTTEPVCPKDLPQIKASNSASIKSVPESGSRGKNVEKTSEKIKITEEVIGKREKSKNVTKGSGVLDSSATVTKSSAQVVVSESELLRICWKEEGSISSYLNNLCKFLSMMQDVVVTETENSKDILFKFPTKKLDIVLKMMGKDVTNSFKKLKTASPKVEVQGSKFFKNKFGLVLPGKNATVAQLSKDFAKFGQVEIESRSQVFVVWFDSKLGFFKALTDWKTLGRRMIPCVQNFKYSIVLVPMDLEQVLVQEAPETKELIDAAPPEDAGNTKAQSFHLSEREIFGFIWQSPKGKIHIRDDQVISRQLTNFIKNVSCKDLTEDEDGLVITFSSQADLTAALSQFCPPPVPDKGKLSSLSRKFTLLPSRGFFGLFSVKRVKPEHFSRFGNCKVRNCGIWFADKLSMFRVLRDPFISKMYSALFIDCRNIYILSSNKVLPPAKSETHVKPAASSDMKSSNQMFQPQGVVTRSATARLPTIDNALKVSKQQEKTATSAPDPVIVTAVSSPSPVTACPLLTTLLAADPTANKPGLQKTRLGSGKFGYMLGKYGHIPSTRLVRTGYKHSRLPVKARTE